MKKLLTFLMMFILSISVGWADEYSWTLSSTNFVTKNGTSTSGGTTTQNSVSWDFSASKYVSSENGTDGKGVQFGSKNNPDATFTLSTTGIPGTITKVDVEASAYSSSATIGVSVGGTSYGSSNLGTTNSTKSFSGSSSGKIIITLTNASSGGRAMYLKSIKVTYSTGGSQATSHDITYAEVTGGTFTGPTSAVEGAEVTIQATPDDGYNFGSWNVTDASGAIIVTDNKFTMGTSNVTVSGTFVAKPTHTVSVTNGIADPEEAYEGQTVTLTPTIPDGKVVDWDNTTVSPSLEINHSDYTFTMPGQAVTVTFAFKDAPTSQTATLTNANIVAAGTGNTGYSDWEITDENGKKWNAHAIKNQHSKATSNYHFLQIRKNDNSGPYFIQVPEYGTKITKLEMTVSDASHDMTSGGNSATLFFSSSNLTSSTGTGIASGTGSSKVTIDCSNFDLNTGYITASGAVRIWDVTVTYESGEVIEVPDLYIIGQVNGHDSDPWVPTEGVKMTYNSTNDNYAANIYCTGVNNGTHEGYSLFLFAKSLPYDWNTTSNLYGSGADGSYWPISGQPNESAFGEEIPLYEGSKNSYRLPAGLYTVTVDLDYTGHEYTTKSVKVTKRDVIMTISPNSATFETTKNVTMSSNLTEIGGKIYYTTNGNDPRDPNSGRIEYTGELTIDATTTFKAVAYVGNLYSDVVEKTYTKTPAAPVITPNGGTIYEATQVTITAESGATIYYTTDGNTPTPENGTQYTAPFTVSATTTVKARAYVDDVFSSITTAEFTYSNVTPSTGDFVLVTDASQLVAGNEYIIMTTDKDGYKLAMGDINSNNKGTWTQEFDITGNVGEAGSKVSVNSEATESNSLVNILELEGTNGSWALKQQSAGKYLNISGDDTNINESDSKVNVSFTIYNNNSAKIQGRSDRQILFSDQNDVFGNYATSNAGKSGFEYVYLYTRESNAVQPPVFTPAGGIYNVDVDVTISCPTSGASILYSTDGTNFQAYTEAITVSETTTLYAKAVKGEQESEVASATYTVTTILAALEAGPVQGKSYAISDLIVAKIIDGIVYAKDNNGAAEQTAVDGQIDYLAERVNTKNTDHSNWIAITGLTDDNLTEGSRLTNVVGTLSDAVNFTLAAQSATVDKPNNEELAINQYVPCNFGVSTQTVGGKTYFFAHPQIMEYAYIFAAVWKGNDTFEVPENNAAGLTGSFTADLNGYEDNLKQGTVYEFHAIVKKAAAGGNGAPRRIAGNGGDYEVMLTEGPKKTSDITTAVDELQSGKAVDGVRYVNVAGQVAATPWQGVNIVVTRYTDGSTRTTKVVK